MMNSYVLEDVMNKNHLRKIILESISRDLIELSSGDVVEYGSAGHIQELQRMEADLKSLKDSMRSGPDRLPLRKEKANLQRAIESLRYLRKKAERVGHSKGILKT
jgi:hypothetical protein